MLAAEINWNDGQVRYWNLDLVDLSRSLEAQADELTEDLAQVVYPGGMLLDIGWYPSMAVDGNFVVTVIRNEDWESPIFKVSCASGNQLQEAIGAAIVAASTTV